MLYCGADVRSAVWETDWKPAPQLGAHSPQTAVTPYDRHSLPKPQVAMHLIHDMRMLPVQWPLLRVDQHRMSSATSTLQQTKSDTKQLERERRRSNRTAHTCEAWLSSPTATDPSDRVEVTTLNFSRHGVCFEIPVKVPTGAYYILRFGIDSQKINSEIRILSCRPGDESFKIGAEFV
jgi:PilZ domain